MNTEQIDSRLKYMEMPNQFKGRANEIALTAKQQLRTCEQLAKRLAMEKPKTPNEFEKIEYYKNFVIRTAQLNEQVLGLLDYTHGLLSAMAADSTLLAEAKIKDTLRFQSDTIELMQQENDKLVKTIYDLKRAEIASK
jgi:hypothetical protein